MKYVLVTGASGGMGLKTCEELIRRGYCVIALDKIVLENKERLIWVQTDVSNEESVSRAYDFVRSITGEIYAVLHFAGIYMLDSLVEIPFEAFERIFRINVFGAYLVNRIFLPIVAPGGRIVITTSELATLDPLPFTGLYAVTKGALDKYAFSLRMELQLLNISVSVLRAGAVDTGMLGTSTAALEAFCSHTQLYKCNSKKFREIVESVEARRIPPEKLAGKICAIIEKRKPRYAYSINRNPLLLLLNALPKCLQLAAIRWILK